MSKDLTKIIAITANIASCFEQLDDLLTSYVEEIFEPIKKCGCKFIALHCQEVGGKNYEDSMKNMDLFFMHIRNRAETLGFTKSDIFLDVEYYCPEKFTALGNLYFVHEDLHQAQIWNFADKVFVDCKDHQEFVGDIEDVPIKEKAKFPQEFFPECKWSRKGFMRTRWQLNGTQIDFVNIHLFHDACNFVAMESFPSKYSLNRKRAMEYTLDKFHNDCLQNVPLFIFGDFNFRLDTGAVVKELSSNCSSEETDVAGEKSKQFMDKDGSRVLKISKKEFTHSNHDSIFLYQDGFWMQPFDREPQQFSNRLCEFPINFPPSYPFEEDLNSGLGHDYMKTRCPAWCDRVLFTKAAKQLIDMGQSESNYGMIGLNAKMGDHKPISLSVSVPNDTTVRCCVPSDPCPNFVHKPAADVTCFVGGDWCRCETTAAQTPTAANCPPSNELVSAHPDDSDADEHPVVPPGGAPARKITAMKRVRSEPVVGEGWLRSKYTHLQVGQSNSLDSHMAQATYKLKTTSSRLVSHHSSSEEEWFEQVPPTSGESVDTCSSRDPPQLPASEIHCHESVGGQPAAVEPTLPIVPCNSNAQTPCLLREGDQKRCCVLS